MAGLLENIDPDGLLEYSVVYTDRSLNHMSTQFQQVMRDIHKTLCEVYQAPSAVIVPGSGSYGMEAVARQVAQNKKCMVVRNGWFSYRWSQIFQAGDIPASETVLMARASSAAPQSPYAPVPVAELVERILEEKPEVVFAPHVETSAGIILDDDYLKSVAEAVHAVGGLFVLDCIASGCMWVDMKHTGVDVLVTAPQKGWSGTPCAGVVMLNERALEVMKNTTSSSFSIDLAKWHSIMAAYLAGKHAYHATMPTDGLVKFRDVMNEIASHDFQSIKLRQAELGQRIRKLMKSHGLISVAADGFEAPGVAVYFTEDDELHSGRAFAAAGMQIAAGVPLQIGEPESYKSFRIGLFGIDKLLDVDAAVARFEKILNTVMAAKQPRKPVAEAEAL